jgi:hypothetical protein
MDTVYVSHNEYEWNVVENTRGSALFIWFFYPGLKEPISGLLTFR